jgi:hypothetical protein
MSKFVSGTKSSELAIVNENYEPQKMVKSGLVLAFGSNDAGKVTWTLESTSTGVEVRRIVNNVVVELLQFDGVVNYTISDLSHFKEEHAKVY